MNPRTETIGRLRGVAEVAALLRVSQRTIRRLVTRGELPCIRVGRQLRFREQDIGLYLNSSRTRPGFR
jgi:excisionase family DNA binding protein